MPPALAQTEQLQRKLLRDLQRVPGMTAASLKSIRSELDKALRGGAPAVTGFVSWLKGELMGPKSDQRPAPQSSARPVPATPVSPRAASAAAALAVDPAAAKTQLGFASALNTAGSLNQRLVPQMQASQDAWNSAQKQMAQFYWQAAGGLAAKPRQQDVLGQLQGSIQALRKAHAQSNDPLAQLKSEQKKLQAIQREAGGVGLAPQTRQTLDQVGKWVQSGQLWRTNLNERIQTLEQWAQAAQTATQARAAAGAQGAALMLAVPPPPAGVAPSVVQAARAAERAQQKQQQTARLPELGSSPPTAVPSSPNAPGARVSHTGGVGTPEQVEQRRRQEFAQELQRVQQQIAESRRTQLAGGSPEDQAQRERDFYDQSRLAQMGVTYKQLLEYLQKPQGPAGIEGAAVRAGMGLGTGGNQPGRTGITQGTPVDESDPWYAFYGEAPQVLDASAVSFYRRGNPKTAIWHEPIMDPEATRRVIEGVRSRMSDSEPGLSAVKSELEKLQAKFTEAWNDRTTQDGERYKEIVAQAALSFLEAKAIILNFSSEHFGNGYQARLRFETAMGANRVQFFKAVNDYLTNPDQVRNTREYTFINDMVDYIVLRFDTTGNRAWRREEVRPGMDSNRAFDRPTTDKMRR